MPPVVAVQQARTCRETRRLSRACFPASRGTVPRGPFASACAQFSKRLLTRKPWLRRLAGTTRCRMNSSTVASVALLFIFCALTCAGSGQVPSDGFLKLGGFRCVDLRPFSNDNYFDLYQTGGWSRASFRMDVWKRLGVPYWYPAGAGNIRVAGAEWLEPDSDIVSDSKHGSVAHADAQRDGNAAGSANDDDPYSFWYSGDDHPKGMLGSTSKSRSASEKSGS